MRFTTLALACVLAACPWPVQAQPATPAAPLQTPAAPLTLDEAWRLAVTANPTLRAKQAQLAAAEGQRADAAAPLYNNPQLSLESTRRNAAMRVKRR